VVHGEGSGCNRALFSFSASSGPPIYGEILATSPFLPTGSTVRSRRLQAAVNTKLTIVLPTGPRVVPAPGGEASSSARDPPLSGDGAPPTRGEKERPSPL